MADEKETLSDGTLVFLPERLNHDPVVLRGLTNDELWMALGVGAGVGTLLGIPMAFASGALAMLPTVMIASMAVSLLAGGSLLRRVKRGRPETWLYRQLQWTLARRWRIGSGALIVHTGPWTVRRSQRLRPPLWRLRP